MTHIPIYDVIIDNETVGLTAISFVDDPAIREEFIAFKNTNHLFMASREKREVVSPVLIPGQLIYRETEDGQPYYIRWDEKAIRSAAEKYLMNGFFNNVTIMHPTFYDTSLNYEDVLEKDVYLLRLWIVEDAETDDINVKYGYSLPKGTLCAHYKVHNRRLWQRIMSGELKGLSIECESYIQRSEDEINLQNMKFDFTSKEMSLIQKFVQFLNSTNESIDDIKKVVDDDNAEGVVTITYQLDDGRTLTVYADGAVRDENDQAIDAGEYQTIDGAYVVIDAASRLVDTKAGSVADSVIEKATKEDEAAEPQINQSLKAKDDEEDEEEDGDVPCEDVPGDGGDDMDAPVEDDPVVDEEAPEDGQGDAEVEIPVDVPVEDILPVEEEPVAEPPLSLVNVEIEGNEYMVPQEVADYINGLLKEKEEAMRAVLSWKAQTPSAEPAVVTPGSTGEQIDGLSAMVARLNRR